MKKKDMAVEVAYICNGKIPGCSQEAGCYYGKQKGPCMHTQDPKYARYKPHDPKKHPERFDKFRAGNVVRYYEKLGERER